ncbi:MAG: efflux RND transporter permease subunit [Cystobacterineae bacterium]|nr:efflux RND transporter permease subunit [Cystobacterineae bacterium]
MLKTFISRPVFTCMLMAAVVVFGLVSFPRIGVDQLPNIDIPVVTVTTLLPGADPESMEKNVSKPLEDALSSLNGVDELKSISLDSVSQLIVFFKLETNLDTAAQDVRDRIQSALRNLPKDVEMPVVEKIDLDSAPILMLSLTGPLPIEALTRAAEDILKPALEAQVGVGSVDVVGGRKREIQLVVEPQSLRGHGLSIGNLSQALAAQSVDIPGGRAMQEGKEFVVRLAAEAQSVEEIGNIIISSPGGTPVRVRDVAAVIDGAQEARGLARSDFGAAIALNVRKQSGANTVQVAEAVKASLENMNAQLPEGLVVKTIIDNSTFIRSSILAVQEDMLLGGILAVLVVLIFLRNARSTLVAAISLPVSVIGTFAVMALLGFTFNIITMLALTLSIGLVIDDAIVVIENIVRHLEQGKPPMQAALEGVRQIALAVFAVTLAIVAVFIPVAFMDGIAGQFFYQFGVTVAVAVLISYAVSMTLAPMLSGRVLKEVSHATPNRVSVWLEQSFLRLESFYKKILAKVLAHRGLVMCGAIGVLALTLGLASLLKISFIPKNDTSSLTVAVELPQGSTLEDTEKELALIAEHVRKMPGVVETFATAGGGTLEEVHKGELIVNLLPVKQRALSQETFKIQLRESLPTPRPGVRLSIQDGAAASSGMRAREVEYALRGSEFATLVSAAEAGLLQMQKNPGFTDVDMNYRAGKPQYNVQINRERAAQLGVVAGQVGAMLRSYLGRDAFMSFREGGESYDVKLRLADATLSSKEALGQLTILSSSGQLVELRNIADIVPAEGPAQINRLNKQREITLFANIAQGYSLGEGMAYLAEHVEAKLPEGVSAGFAGTSKEMGKTLNAFAMALILGVVLLYMILAAQFESLIHPFTIMLALPFALIGGVTALLVTGQALSMFALIGVIMLMGVVVKNGILLVEFTLQLREEGKNAHEALLEAAPIRMRPILMTSIAMIAGMVPMLLAQGDGAAMRMPMALVVIGGLISSTVLTLLIVPVVYSLIDGFMSKLKNKVRKKASSKAPTTNVATPEALAS